MRLPTAITMFAAAAITACTAPRDYDTARDDNTIDLFKPANGFVLEQIIPPSSVAGRPAELHYTNARDTAVTAQLYVNLTEKVADDLPADQSIKKIRAQLLTADKILQANLEDDSQAHLTKYLEHFPGEKFGEDRAQLFGAAHGLGDFGDPGVPQPAGAIEQAVMNRLFMPGHDPHLPAYEDGKRWNVSPGFKSTIAPVTPQPPRP